MPGSACTTPGLKPASMRGPARGELVRAHDAVQRGCRRRPARRSGGRRSSTVKFWLVMPPFSGRGSTRPDQIAQLGDARRCTLPRRVSAHLCARPVGRRASAPAVWINRSAIIAMAATQSPATRPRPVSALVKRDVDLLAEIARADQRGDDQHGEREHDRLVDAEQNDRRRQRQAHLRQELARRAASRRAGLDQRGLNVADAVRGVADRRRERVEHDGDHGGEIADPEQHDHR